MQNECLHLANVVRLKRVCDHSRPSVMVANRVVPSFFPLAPFPQELDPSVAEVCSIEAQVEGFKYVVMVVQAE